MGLENVKIGVCTIEFDGVDLGLTKGGVSVSYEPEYHGIEVDQYGTSKTDGVLIGDEIVATVPLAEATHENILTALSTAGTEEIDGVDVDKKKVTVGQKPGARQSTKAAKLVLHPIEKTVDDKSGDVTLHKASPRNAVELNFEVDGERVIEVEFEGLIDETKDDGDLKASFGDDSADVSAG